MVESHTDESVQNAILKHLSDSNIIEDTLELAKSLGITHLELDKSLKSLLVDEYLSLQVIEKKLLELTPEGASYADNGTPEFIYASALEVKVPTEKSQADAKVGAEVAKIGFSKAMQRKWIQLDPSNKNIVIRIAEALEDSEKEQLRKYRENPDLEKHDKKDVDQMKKRKLLNQISLKSYRVTKGDNF